MAVYRRIEATIKFLEVAEKLRPDFLKDCWKLKDKQGDQFDIALLDVFDIYTHNRHRTLMFQEIKRKIYNEYFSFTDKDEFAIYKKKREAETFEEYKKEAKELLSGLEHTQEQMIKAAYLIKEKVEKCVENSSLFKFSCEGFKCFKETEKEARKRIADSFKEGLDRHILDQHIKNAYWFFEIKEFDNVIFEWTVRRMIEQRETLDEIKGRADISDVSKKSNSLAKFLGLKIKPMTKQKHNIYHKNK
jgi:hypothetical protein